MFKGKKIFQLILSIALLLSLTFLVLPKSTYAAGIINGGFESGNFMGWNVSFDPGISLVPGMPSTGNAQVVTSYTNVATNTTYAAKEGNYFALLTAGSHLVYTTVSQTFGADKGGVVSGWAFFSSIDYLPWNDSGRVDISILNTMDGTSATVFYADVVSVGNYGGTPWTFWSYTIPSRSQYVIRARVINDWDDLVPSVIGLDGVILYQLNKSFKDGDSSPTMPAQFMASGADTKVLTAFAEPSQVIAGQPVKIMANVVNRGDIDGSITAKLTINGQIEDSKQVYIPGNKGKPIEFTVIKDKPGIYSVDVNGKQAYFTVVAASGGSDSKLIAYTIIGVMGVLTALVGAALFMRRRSSV